MAASHVAHGLGDMVVRSYRTYWYIWYVVFYTAFAVAMIVKKPREFAALIRDFPEEYARYYAIKEFRYNNITQPNRNRLLWTDPYVDGMKTGHTDAAGWCLVAAAKRGQRRLLSVVLGAPSDAARASESQKLLNYGFQAFDTVQLYQSGQAISSLPGPSPT